MFLSHTHSLLLALADPQGPAATVPAPPEPSRLRSLLELADWHGVLPAVIDNLQVLRQKSSRPQLSAGPGEKGRGERAPACSSHDRQGPMACPTADSPDERWHSFSLETAAGQWAAQRLRHRAALSLLLRQQAQEVVGHARQAGLPVLVLKGCDFADRLYSRPALRPFTDVDLLVPESVRESLRQVLRDLGYQPVVPSMKHSTGYGEESWRRDHQPGGTVELHWNLVNSPSLRQGLSVRYEDLQIETNCGQPCPSAAATLLIAAVHGVASHGLDRLQALVDVAQAARGMAGPLDMAWLEEVAARTGSARALALALALAGSALGDAACRELHRSGHRAWLGQLLVSPAVVLRAHAPLDSFRRQLLREWLKRT